MLRRGLGLLWIVGVVGLGLVTLRASRAHACGGLFCNGAQAQPQPVNQAAERILFVHNGDGTVTAVIEIQYQGPADRFSWVLPVPGTPEIAVSSTVAFDRMQAATNPLYQLQTTFDTCGGGAGSGGRGGSGGGFATAGSGGSAGEGSGVMVIATGTVGPFDYEVIALDPSLPDPAMVAIMWLEENDYAVTALAPGVLGPYLENGLNLLAFRLNKQNDSGSIRPIRITYDSELPFIPIRPTAVAAQDDMGVMVWVASSARAVPDNYKALELNEALINWFSPMSTYNDVVSAAADEAEGQGFVTEFAGPSSTFDQTVLADFEEQDFQSILNQAYSSPVEFLLEVSGYYGQWDGFEDALRVSLTLPPEISLSEFAGCPNCYVNDAGVMLDESAFRRALYEQVFRPMLETQELLSSRPYVTRLYTTMSADEMTLDPAFNFNSDQPNYSNIHTAQQTIACDGGFRVTLADGTTVYGQSRGVWPNQLGGELPAARKIMQLGTQGQGRVIVDNSERIAELLAAQRPPDRPPTAGRSGGSGSGGSGGGAGQAGRQATLDGGMSDAGAAGRAGDCHCSTTVGAASSGGPYAPLLALLVLGWLVARSGRRR